MQPDKAGKLLGNSSNCKTIMFVVNVNDNNNITCSLEI